MKGICDGRRIEFVARYKPSIMTMGVIALLLAAFNIRARDEINAIMMIFFEFFRHLVNDPFI